MNGINRVAFTLFGFPIYWYGLIIALGMLLGVLIASAREKKYEQPKDTILNFILIALPIALICARLYYVAFSWENYVSHPAEILNIRSGGMAIYGGVIGGVITGFIYSRVKNLSFSVLADLCAPALALGQAIGRWGNFFNEEAYGSLIENASLHFFPMGVYIESLGQWRYATFFYESSWCFLLCAALLIAEARNLFRHRGDVFLWYLLAYSAERMVVEGMRSDSLYMGSLRISQLLSAGMLIICAIVFCVRCVSKKKLPLFCFILFGLLAVSLPFSLTLLPILLQVLHALLLLIVSACLYKNTL